MELTKIYLKPGKEKSIMRFHPWVFSGAIKRMEGSPVEGDLVEVHANKGRFLGVGHYGEQSIAVRLLAFEERAIDADFWLEKVRSAFQLRERLGFIDNQETNVYRLMHAEGDNVPGLIIDMYNGTAVIQAHSAGMHHAKAEIVAALKEVYGDQLKAVYDKSAETLPKKSNIAVENGYLYGAENAVKDVVENGHKFHVDWETGQKTGFFIDQRDNRELLSRYAKGKKILNTFCYSGGFSIYGLNKGAAEVHSLDSSQKAIDLVDKNVALIDGEVNHKSIVADAMDYIKGLETEYDIIVLDPPAFAKHRSAKHNAVQGYKRLNARAIEQIKPGGIIFTFSCSQVVDKALFYHTITAAAISAGRKIRVLHRLEQPADHPVNIFHPEGEYLKGLVIQVEE
jgi:23S rRNA (cytosine1962-C5)-methyltransferase